MNTTPANLTENVHPLFTQRKSRRAFNANKPVTDADLHAILEAARWSPSSNNAQPWKYIVGRQGDATYAKLLALLMPFNAGWAQTAPVLILTIAEVERTREDGSKAGNRSALHDLGMANVSIALQAEHSGMNVRMMGGYNYEAALDMLDAKAKGWDLGPMLALGFIGDVNALPEELQKREHAPRARKSVDEILVKL